jgi:nucleotide-binding universal stress UspA family protein
MCVMPQKPTRRWPWTAIPKLPDAPTLAPSSIMLASEGQPISTAAIEYAAELSRAASAPVHVFMITRIWGSSFGLPHPGLMPTKREWQAQHDAVAETVRQLQMRGVEARGSVVSSRNASGRILKEAAQLAPDAIVMAAPPPQHWLFAGLFWDQEPYRVRRLAKCPVYLVVAKGAAERNDRAPGKKPRHRLFA